MQKAQFKSEVVYDKLGNALMRVCYMGADGLQREKTVSLTDYLKIINNSMYFNGGQGISIGKLPRGYYNGWLFSEPKATFEVIIDCPAEKRAVLFANRHWYVPFPNLVFFFKVCDGILQTKQCFSYAEEKLNDDTELYLYPFGNVGKTGHICMGNIVQQRLDSILDIENVVENFFLSETNNDFYIDKNQTGMPQEKLLGKLKNMQQFPSEWLPKCANHLTVADLHRTI